MSKLLFYHFKHYFTMKDMKSEIKKRYLCEQRDKEFLALYHPTLDAMLEQGMSESQARRAAVKFTIANGRPHYPVDHERAYRCVCHLLNANDKKASNARTYRTIDDTAFVKKFDCFFAKNLFFFLKTIVRQPIISGNGFNVLLVN